MTTRSPVQIRPLPTLTGAQAKLVCIDIQPYAHSEAQERADVLNVGGFSDQVFMLVAEFAAGRLTDGHWVGVIEKVEI